MITITTNEDNFNNELLNHIREINNKEIPRQIYHYTSIESLFAGILINDNKEPKICLRATNALYLNDPKEVKIGLSFLEKIFGTKIINDYNDYLEYSSNYFVTSFSCNKDELPMWDMYTKDSSGIVLCFDSNMIPQKSSLINCIYEDDKIIEIIDKYIKNNENKTKENNNNLYSSNSLWCFAFIFSLIIIVYAHNEEFREEFNKQIASADEITDEERAKVYEKFGGVPEYEENVLVFGAVVSGNEVIKAISEGKNYGFTGGFSALEPVKINSVEIIFTTAEN